MSKMSFVGRARQPFRTTRTVMAGMKNVIFRLSGTGISYSLAASSKLNERKRMRSFGWTGASHLHINQMYLMHRVSVTCGDMIEMSLVGAVLLNFQPLTDIDNGNSGVFQFEKDCGLW